MKPRALRAATSRAFFRYVHGHFLVYNTCWEDPRLDREAMRLTPEDTVLTISSAGCNVLDYLLDGPRRIHAVDMNPRQNALLELKAAGIRHLDFETFFSLFGQGHFPKFPKVYREKLRPSLSQDARQFWDPRGHYFQRKKPRRGFYFRGTAGRFARLINFYIDRVAKVRPQIQAMLNAPSLEEQQRIYREQVGQAFWGRFIRWLIARDAMLSLVGVPRPQREQVDLFYEGGIAQFVQDAVTTVFAELPLEDNYFWRVYLEGEYTRECCPEYLREENFHRLKSGLIDRLSIHTSTIHDFLENQDVSISRYVLLDHMDWLSSDARDVLQREWQAIVDRAAPNCRILYRSGGLKVDYLDPVPVRVAGRYHRLGGLLRHDRPLAERLHRRDRVHTYGSFYVADLKRPSEPLQAEVMA